MLRRFLQKAIRGTGGNSPPPLPLRFAGFSSHAASIQTAYNPDAARCASPFASRAAFQLIKGSFIPPGFAVVLFIPPCGTPYSANVRGCYDPRPCNSRIKFARINCDLIMRAFFANPVQLLRDRALIATKKYAECTTPLCSLTDGRPSGTREFVGELERDPTSRIESRTDSTLNFTVERCLNGRIRSNAPIEWKTLWRRKALRI